jgi:hypothetical protein
MAMATPTISYDKKTHDSYTNILDDRPYRSAQPRARFPIASILLRVLTTPAETCDLSSSRRCREFSLCMYLSIKSNSRAKGIRWYYNVILSPPLTAETSSTDINQPPCTGIWNAQTSGYFSPTKGHAGRNRSVPFVGLHRLPQKVHMLTFYSLIAGSLPITPNNLRRHYKDTGWGQIRTVPCSTACTSFARYMLAQASTLQRSWSGAIPTLQ